MGIQDTVPGNIYQHISDGAWKCPTVQTWKKFKFEILLKDSVCIAHFLAGSLFTTVCTASGIVEKRIVYGFDRWLTWQVGQPSQFYHQANRNSPVSSE